LLKPDGGFQPRYSLPGRRHLRGGSVRIVVITTILIRF